MDINDIDNYYSLLKSFIVDNLFLYIILYFIIVKTENKLLMVLYIILAIIIHIVIKLLFRMYTNLGSTLRSSECLNIMNRLSVNKINKSISFADEETLNRPLKDFIINSSHNTYIACNQNADVASLDAIKSTLALGARFIELDVYPNNNMGTEPNDMIPIVAHGAKRDPNRNIFTTNKLLFEDCLDVIAQYGFMVDDPLFLYIENNTRNHIQTQEIMAKLIKNKLGDKLPSITTANGKEMTLTISNEHNFNTFDAVIFNYPIKNLLGKIIIIMNNPQGMMKEMVSIIPNINRDTFRMYFRDNTDITNFKKDNEYTTQVVRIYPKGNLMGHFSYNYDPTPLWNKGFQFVSLNFTNYDSNLKKNLEKFKEYNMILKPTSKMDI